MAAICSLSCTLPTREIKTPTEPLDASTMAPSPVSIKVNALKRLIKEEQIYRQEVAEQELHVAQMTAANADEYEVRKQQEVLEEAHKMVPEVAAKIQQHREALAAFLQSYKGDEDVAEARALV